MGVFLFVFLCWGGCHAYSVVESQRLTRRGGAYLGGNDVRQAALSARRALQLNPYNVGAMRVLARAAEALNDRSALDWRRKAVELDAHSVENALALINCALQFNDVVTAKKALDGIDENARDTAEFHAASARLAESEKKFAESEGEWEKAALLAPNNNSYQLQFAFSLLRMNDSEKRDKALSILQGLRGDLAQRASATRALFADGVTHHSPGEELVALARELQDYPEATFNDRILYLDIMRQLQDPEFTPYLTRIEKEVVTNPNDLAALLAWMKTSGMSLLAVDFAATLPNEQLNKWPVPLALAEAHAKLGDWSVLETFMTNQKWDQFEFLDHAYLALALRQQGKLKASQSEWNAAKKEAGGESQYLWTLSRAATEWGWHDEATDMLWTLSKQPDAQNEALQNLYQQYFEAKDTFGLYRVLGRLAELQPKDPGIQNNLAQVSLLLNIDTERASKAAADVYHKESSNPAYATTYAFSLFMKGDLKGAVGIMNGLTEAQLRDPAVAAYYGIVLAAAGDPAKAQEYLRTGASAKLLPEEKALLAKAEHSSK